MYRTGDLVRWRDDGCWIFSAARTSRSRSAAFGSSRARSRRRCARQPGVAQAVVVAREDQPGQKQLVGYIVPATGDASGPLVLRRALAAELPDYMVPAAIVALERAADAERQARPPGVAGAGVCVP